MIQQRLKQIQAMPTRLDSVDQSVFRNSSILEHVLVMVDRGDTKETIFEVVEFLKECPLDTETVIATVKYDH